MRSGTYEIHLRHRIGAEMVHRLADLRPEVCGDHTLLRTAGVDQPTLHGTMARLADLGLEISSVERIDDSD